MTRRELIAAVAKLGLATGLGYVPRSSLAQAAVAKDPRLIARSVRPPDFETPVALLDSFLTPAPSFFVRSHMSVPQVDEAAWTLAIEGEIPAPSTISLAELKRMPRASVTTTMECAGNGRAFFEPPVAGVQWRRGAVGTARWTGVRLADLLKRAGARAGATHVWMSGADRPLGTQPAFVRQLPIAKALHADTLVAYAMNDGSIPLLNGAPLRLIVPGWEGAYSLKWLNRLTVARGEYDGFWVANAYRYPQSPVTPGAVVSAREMAPLRGLVVKSLITRPLDAALVAPGKTMIAGYAWAGEERIARVEISIDDGASWKVARLTGQRVDYAWRRFEYAADLVDGHTYAIRSRATDARGNTQPLAPGWNPSGYLWNAPDQIRVEVSRTSSRGSTRTAPPLAASHDPASPAGSDPGESVYQSACRVCHGDDLVEQQRLSEASWGRTVDKMVQWGARVESERRASLLRYLASRFGQP
jgi:DMSO/TMAO reductase YedYZ molybdopterin-dependent catalytic subunit/mono/diheme cytochrome c family protein